MDRISEQQVKEDAHGYALDLQARADDLVREKQKAYPDLFELTAEQQARERRMLGSLAIETVFAQESALYDERTGLLNQAGFFKSFDEVDVRIGAYRDAQVTGDIERATQIQLELKGVGLLVGDLDGFKAINTVIKHPGGDAVLEAVGTHIRRKMRAGERLARPGGDEFAGLILQGADDEERMQIMISRVREIVQDAVEELCGEEQLQKLYEIALVENPDVSLSQVEQAVRGLGISLDIAELDLEKHETMADVYKEADAKMFADKAERKAKLKIGRGRKLLNLLKRMF